MIQIIIEGLLLGLSSGAYCAGTCLVFFMPYLLVEGRERPGENLNKILLFLSGRLIAYIAFAVFAGFIGTSQRDIFSAKFSHISLAAASLFMLIYALSHNFSETGACKFLLQRFSLMRIPFFLGLFTGLNPCLPFLVGVARLWTLHSIFRGVIMFIAFFCGTALYMIPLVFIAYLNRLERVKRIGLIIALLSSIWFLFVGIAGLLG